MVGAAFFAGILYLMVLALLAMSDEFIFGDQTPIDDRNEQPNVTPNTLVDNYFHPVDGVAPGSRESIR